MEAKVKLKGPLCYSSPLDFILSDFIQLIYSNPIPLMLILILLSHLVRKILRVLLFAVFQPKFAHAVLISPSVLHVRSNDSVIV
jgi:hypothetical protein